MTTEAQAVEAVVLQFTTAWASLHPADCPIALEGENYDGPAQWVRLSFVPSKRMQATIGPVGARRAHTEGVVAIEVFVDVNQGMLRRAQLCDDVRTAIEMKRINAVGSTDAEPVRIYAGASQSPTTDGRWLKQTVIAPFDYDAAAV